MKRKKKKLTPKQHRRRLLMALSLLSIMFIFTFINIGKKDKSNVCEPKPEELLMDASIDSLLKSAGFKDITWQVRDSVERLAETKKDGTIDTVSVRKIHFGNNQEKYVTFQILDSKGKQRLRYTGPAYQPKPHSKSNTHE